VTSLVETVSCDTLEQFSPAGRFPVFVIVCSSDFELGENCESIAP
jgi:hypothetical protein